MLEHVLNKEIGFNEAIKITESVILFLVANNRLKMDKKPFLPKILCIYMFGEMMNHLKPIISNSRKYLTKEITGIRGMIKRREDKIVTLKKEIESFQEKLSSSLRERELINSLSKRKYNKKNKNVKNGSDKNKKKKK